MEIKVGDHVEFRGKNYYVVNDYYTLCNDYDYITVNPVARHEVKLISRIKLNIGNLYLNYRFRSVDTKGLKMDNGSSQYHIPFNFALKSIDLYTPINQGESEMQPNKHNDDYCPLCNFEETPLDAKALELAKHQAIDNALAEKKRLYEVVIKEYMELERKRVEITEKCKAMEKILKITPAFKKSMF